MTFDVDGLWAVLVFIVPGFASYYARTYMTEVPSREFSAFEETQVSLLNSILIITVEAWLFIGIALLIPGLALTDDLLQIASIGISNFIGLHPFRSVLYSSLWLTASIALGLIFGICNPVDRILQRFVSKDLHQADVWYQVIHARLKETKKQRSYIAVTLDNGDLYTGFLAFFSLAQKDSGSRDIALQYVTYYPQGDMNQRQDMRDWQGHGLVILNTTRIVAIRVKYEDEVPVTA